jgi:hypothetical protein
VKNRRKTVSTEEKLYVIRWLGKGERIVDIRRNVKFTHISICSIRDDADKITESAKS